MFEAWGGWPRLLKPATIVDIRWDKNCLLVELDGSEQCVPAIENERGCFNLFKKSSVNNSQYYLDFECIDNQRNLEFGNWTIIDSLTQFALYVDDQLKQQLESANRIFKVAEERNVYEVSFSIREKFKSERLVVSFARCKNGDVITVEKKPRVIFIFFARLGIYILRFVYFVMKVLPLKEKYVFISKLSKTPPEDMQMLRDYILSVRPDAKIVMLAKPMHPYIKYVPHMFRQMYHLATAKVVFLDRSCLVVHLLKHKKELKIIQMWHAIGAMKAFGCANIDTTEGQSHQLTDLFHMHRGYTSILISSKKFENDFIEGFGIKSSEANERLVEIPLPRCDFLSNPNEVLKRRRSIETKIPRLKQKTNILDAPTDRMTADAKRDAGKAYQKLLDCLDSEKYNVIYSPHPLSRSNINDKKVVRVGGSTLNRLCVTDIVISDYSTIIYEAGLIGLPIYLYGFDYDDYNLNRKLNIDVKNEIPLPFYSEAKELCSSIERNEFDSLKFQKFVSDYVHMPSGKSCCRAIFDFANE